MPGPTTPFEPVELAPFCTAPWPTGQGAANAAHERSRPRPDHGIPFAVVARDGATRVVALGGEDDPAEVRIPLHRSAHHVVIAHALEAFNVVVEPATLCASYGFVLEGGQELSVPIRAQIEIGAVDDGWGLHPKFARSDRSDSLPPRYDLPWARAGARLTEIEPGMPPERSYLWTWSNPDPERTIEELVVRPAGPRFAILAITLVHEPGPVFADSPPRPVRIELPQAGDAERPFSLEVRVDRGVATYPFALPATPDGGLAGFGEPPNRSSSPAYVQISALPSAAVTVRLGDDEVGSFRFGDLEDAGELEPTPRLRVQLRDPGRNWVRTTVVDDVTGEPVPCRIRFRTADGIPFQPHGHHAHIASDQEPWNLDVGGDLRLGHVTYAYVDGRCEGWLPRGEVVVEAARGFEYEPIRRTIDVGPDWHELELRLRRIADPRAEGWHAGDTHVHFLSPPGAHLEAAAEGLEVVNLLMAQWGSLFTNTEDFTGEPSVDPRSGTIVHVGSENRQHTLGHIGLLGLRRPVTPWSSDGPDEAELAGPLETTLSRWADECHEQDGTVLLSHFPYPYCEQPALIATGRADAVEWLLQDRRGHREYYRYLNLGYRLPLAGGTDKMGNDTAVGLCRTYVRLAEDEPLTHASWRRGLTAGRTFVTTGPLLTLQVDGALPGDVVALPANGGEVEVTANVTSIVPLGSLQIVMNGEVVASTEPPGPDRSLHIAERLSVDRHSWIAARCGGATYFDGPTHVDAWERPFFAHTSPVYVSVGGDWEMFNPALARVPLELLHTGARYVRMRGASSHSDLVTHRHGRPDHVAYLEEPFLDAIARLEERTRR